jgi:PAS domain-containing protein
VLDPDGSILAWSDSAASLYGWAAVDAVGHGLESLVGMGSPPAGVRLQEEVRSGLRARRRKDGVWFTVDVLQLAISAAEGLGPCLLDYSRHPAEVEAGLADLQELAVFPAALQLAMSKAGKDLTLCPYCNWVEEAPGRWVDSRGGPIDLTGRRLVPGLCPSCAGVEGIGR